MKRLYFLSFTLLASFLASAQHSSIAYKKLADSLYRNHSYQNAAVYYEKAIKKSTEPGVIMLQIAKSYSHLNKPKEAEHWFEEARNHHAHLSDAEMYLYIRALLSLEKRELAEEELTVLLDNDPNDVFARQTLDDLRNFQKYYRDSLSSSITNLPINTPAAEFGPVYYKDGIVFSSAQQEEYLKKKYHWDNSHFLNLYYSASVNGILQKPVLFDKKLDSDFHDGPASFYDNGQKMIVNRNELHNDPANKKSSYWYLALYDAHRDAAKGWLLTPLPFNEPPYSSAHPAVSADGNTLYFVSDKIGGYGGTDVYRVERKNGVWGKPFNVGPAINTFGDESFPFFSNNTLYFASNGRGGLGGLDIFKSEQTINGFTSPINLGFPINSNFDDFSMVISDDGETGYFSSSRNGNDDLFSFKRRAENITLLAHVYDGQTKESLQGATIQLITDTGNDLTLQADEEGLVKFDLPKKANYVIIGSKDNKSGMQSGIALEQEDYLHTTHPIAAFGDTTRIPCIGLIKNESGVSENPVRVTVLDKTTGKKTTYEQDHPMVSFLGEKGHTYSVEIQNERGDTTVHELIINADDTMAKTWTMVLKESSSNLIFAARAFNATDQSVLSNADVKIITFTEDDDQRSTNDAGEVEFSLPNGSAYMILASKDGLTGMHSGIATAETSKTVVTHPIPAYSSTEEQVPVIALITDREGTLIKDAKVTVTERATGKQIQAQSSNGVLSFFGEKEKEYTVTVEHNNYQSASQDILIPSTTSGTEKLSIPLNPKQNNTVSFLMAAKTIKKEDAQIIANANIKISSFTEEDINLKSNNAGIAEFSLAKGTAFILIADADGYTGLLASTAEEGTDKSTIIHPVQMVTDNGKTLPVMVSIKDKQGNVLHEATATVSVDASGQQLPVVSTKGLVSFLGKKGNDHTLTVTHKDYAPASTTIHIPASATEIKKISVVLDNKKLIIEKPQFKNATTLPLVATISNTEGKTVPDVVVSVKEKYTNHIIPASYDNGRLNFEGDKGKAYTVTLQHKNYVSTSEEISIPLEATVLTETAFTLQEKKVLPKNALPVVAHITTTTGDDLTAAKFVVVDKASGKTVPTVFENSNLSFTGEKGHDYVITAEHNNYQPVIKKIAIPSAVNKAPKIEIVLPEKPKPVVLPVVTIITDVQGQILSDALVTVTEQSTGKKVEAQVVNGTVTFNGEKGKEYTLSVDHINYNPASKSFIIPERSTAEKNTIALEAKPSVTAEVATTVTDRNGTILHNAKIIVTEKKTGRVVQTEFKDELLTFSGTKGEEYTITVTHANYKPGSIEFSIPSDETALNKNVIALEEKSTKTLPVITTINDQNGNTLPDANVTVTESLTGKTVEAQFTNGVLNFAADQATTYTITVDHPKYNTATTQLTVPADVTETEKNTITLQDKSSQRTLPVIVAIADGSGNTLTAADIVVTDTSTGKTIPAKLSEGTLQFDGEKGKEYSVTVNHVNYKTAVKQLTIPNDTTTTLNEKIILESNEVPLPVGIHVTDNNGKTLTDASVTVLQNETGKQIPAKLTNGVLTFNGEPGASYTIVVKHKDYDPASKQLVIPTTSPDVKKLSITLSKRASLPLPITMAAHIFKADSNEPLINADVRITSFTEPDIELHTNENGIVVFTLPNTTSYILIANKDGYTGLYSGIADVGVSKDSITLEVPAFNDPEKQIPVIGLATDDDGNMITDIQIIVINNATGERLPAKVENGFISFFGKNGNSYTIETAASGYETQTSHINIDPSDPNAHKLVINLISKNKTPSSVDSHFIIVKNADQTSRYYVSMANAHYEITEKDGYLYLENDQDKKMLGRGTLNEAKSKADSLIASLGLLSTETLTIGNVYFEHNKAQLDDGDKKEIEKIKDLMLRYPSLKLNIGAHADDRGSDNYNLKLSQKRARSIATYLSRHGVSRDRILEEFYGESLPATPCITIECTEDERQKNRRAEFAFRSTTTKATAIAATKPVVAQAEKKIIKETKDDYTDKIQHYGDRKLDSLSFKISIGAYRYNSTLTFDNLKDLGTVEIIFEDGITYYYLSDYKTLKEMEKVRQQVIKRGVKDASFIILYNNEKIPFSKFISLTENQGNL